MVILVLNVIRSRIHYCSVIIPMFDPTLCICSIVDVNYLLDVPVLFVSETDCVIDVWSLRYCRWCSKVYAPAVNSTRSLIRDQLT